MRERQSLQKARQTFQEAEKDGINIVIHWQGADSSSSNAVSELFPDAEIMICGGHAGRAHKKQLDAMYKQKTFSDAFKNRHKDRFPQVLDVKCKCTKRHSQGCGCLSLAFNEKARNNFSFILTESQSADEFSKRIRMLVRHAHTWEDEQCDFHPLRGCSCGMCEKGTSNQETLLRIQPGVNFSFININGVRISCTVSWLWWLL